MILEAPTTHRYWVGDLCYVLRDVWSEVCDLTPFDNSATEFELSDGRKFFLFSTAYGDGEYYDDQGNRYPVDSGTIGAILYDDIRDENPSLEGGVVHDFLDELDPEECYYDEGLIVIESVIIDTGSFLEEEEEDYEFCDSDA